MQQIENGDDFFNPKIMFEIFTVSVLAVSGKIWHTNAQPSPKGKSVADAARCIELEKVLCFGCSCIPKSWMTNEGRPSELEKKCENATALFASESGKQGNLLKGIDKKTVRREGIEPF